MLAAMLVLGRGAWSLAAALSVAALVAACARRGADGAPRPVPPAAARAQACEGCHAEIAEEWRASLHRGAFTDAAFARAYARESRAFCKDCHAPEGDPQAGVSCASCHVPDRRPPRPGAPHPPHRAGEGVSGACARCHEFAFDGRRDDAALMQSTVREHAASPSRDTPCAGCHMPRTGAHRSHRFAVSRDPDALRAALRVEAAREGESAVRLRLRPVGVGHAFPTGDLFRSLRISLETDDADARPPRAPLVATRTLSRRFTTERTRDGAIAVVEVADDRLAPDRTSEVVLDLGEGARRRPLLWKVEYHRAEVPSDDPPPSARVLLHSGTLSP